jgi:hypothetical protein
LASKSSLGRPSGIAVSGNDRSLLLQKYITYKYSIFCGQNAESLMLNKAVRLVQPYLT